MFVAHGSYVLTMCAAFIFLLLWFLKLFAQQEWSAVVTRTLVGSASHVLRFMVIFMAMDLVFSITAHLFFGMDQDSFRTVFESTMTTIQYSVFGADWDAVNTHRYPLTSLVWFWLFTIFQMMIMYVTRPHRPLP